MPTTFEILDKLINGIKEAFFGDQNPIGKHIKMDEMRFRVIGVLEKQGKFVCLS